VLQLVEGFMPEVAWLDDGETLTYLHSTISTRSQRVRVPETPMHLDALLADESLTGGLEPRLDPKGRSKSGAVATGQTATLETEFCGQRLSTPRAVNEPQRRWDRHGRPATAVSSRGNVVLFCGLGNHVDLRGLPGGAEGIRTSDLRRQAPALHRPPLPILQGLYQILPRSDGW
jgi:hypothetical protein